MLKRTVNKKYTYEWTALENFGGECTVDDIIKKATKSQKIALILETYCDMNMKYNKDSFPGAYALCRRQRRAFHSLSLYE